MILFIEHMSFTVHLKDVIDMKKYSKLTHGREDGSRETVKRDLYFFLYFEFFKTVTCIMKTKQRSSISVNVG